MIKIIPNWRTVAWRSMVVWVASIGVVLPDILNILADNISGFPWLNDGYKSIIRTVCLVLVVVVRFVHQPALREDRHD